MGLEPHLNGLPPLMGESGMQRRAQGEAQGRCEVYGLGIKGMVYEEGTHFAVADSGRRLGRCEVNRFILYGLADKRGGACLVTGEY